ncbi:MAG: HEAT repeat domain-containing protein [Gemmataceae bacterium]|nr:HEAT repeat domain-containing protein [Gemmataceae bacterium]
MKRLLWLSAALLALFAAQDAGAAGCCTDKCHCTTPPPADCPDCSEACDKCRIGSPFGAEHARKLTDQLCDGNCCERVKAVKKLGCRLHADICKCPDVLHAIIHALQCDTCWEVRREAALALMHQNARVPQAVVALYIASKIDRHYMVRDGALMALDVLLVCRRDCYPRWRSRDRFSSVS